MWRWGEILSSHTSCALLCCPSVSAYTTKGVLRTKPKPRPILLRLHLHLHLHLYLIYLLSYHLTSYHITSYHITYYVVPHSVISYHTISYTCSVILFVLPKLAKSQKFETSIDSSLFTSIISFPSLPFLSFPYPTLQTPIFFFICLICILILSNSLLLKFRIYPKRILVCVLSTSLSVHMYGHHVDTVCAVWYCVWCVCLLRLSALYCACSVVCVECCVVYLLQCLCCVCVVYILCAAVQYCNADWTRPVLRWQQQSYTILYFTWFLLLF
jgi:hypothetical protein